MKPCKRLEYDLAIFLNGKRIAQRHYGHSVPDVIKDLSDGRRLVCDAKRRKDAAVVHQIEKVEKKRCSKGGQDIALIYNLSDGRRLVYDKQTRKDAAVVSQIKKVESQYCSKDGKDIALVYTHPHFKHTGVISVRREFFVELLEKAGLI